MLGAGATARWSMLRNTKQSTSSTMRRDSSVCPSAATFAKDPACHAFAQRGRSTDGAADTLTPWARKSASYRIWRSPETSSRIGRRVPTRRRDSTKRSARETSFRYAANGAPCCRWRTRVRSKPYSMAMAARGWRLVRQLSFRRWKRQHPSPAPQSHPPQAGTGTQAGSRLRGSFGAVGNRSSAQAHVYARGLVPHCACAEPVWLRGGMPGSGRAAGRGGLLKFDPTRTVGT